MSGTKFVRRLLLASLLLVLIVISATGLLVSTQTGTRWVANLAQSAVPALSLGAVSGRLVDQLEIEQLHYADEAVAISLDKLLLQWRLAALLHSELAVDQIRISGVTVIPGTSDAAASEPISAVGLPQLPLQISLGELLVEGIKIGEADAAVMIERVSLAAEMNRAVLNVSQLDVVAEQGELKANFAARGTDQLSLSGEARLGAQIGDAKELVELKFAGPLDALVTSLVASGPYAAKLELTLDVLDEPALTGRASVTDIADLTLQHAPIKLKFEGGLDALTATAQTVLEPESGAIVVEIVLDYLAENKQTLGFRWGVSSAQDNVIPASSGGGQLSFDSNKQSLTITHHSAAPLKSTLSGEVRELDRTPVLDLNLHFPGDDLSTLVQQAVILGPSTLQVSGAVSDLHSEAKITLEQSPAGPLAAELKASLINNSQFDAALGVDMLSGRVDVQAQGHLKDALSGLIQIHGEQLDLATFNPELSSDLKLVASVALTQTDSALETQLDLQDLSGDWRGYDIRARGAAVVVGEAVSVREFRAALGRNIVTASGDIGASIAADFDANMPALDALLPGLSGSLDANGRITGLRTAPEIVAQAELKDIGFGDISLKAGVLDAAIAVDDKKSSELRLNLNKLILPGISFDDARLGASGSPAALNYSLELTGPLVDIGLNGQGSYVNDVLKTRLLEFALNSSQWGQWALAAPATIQYLDGKASIERSCLNAGDSKLCFLLSEWSNASGAADLLLQQFDIATLQPYLPTTTRLGGQLDATAQLNMSAAGVAGEGQLELHSGAITLINELDTAAPGETVSFQTMSAGFVLQPEAVRGQLKAAVHQWFELDGTFDVGLSDKKLLAIALRAEAPDIEWMGQFVPAIAGSDAAMQLDAKITGSASKPQINANARLTGGRLFLPQSGTAITRLDIELVNRDGVTTSMDGVIGAADQTLHLVGHLELPESNAWRAQLKLNGEQFPLVRLPDAEADISPALDLALTPDLISLKGQIKLPRVKVVVNSVPPSAVAISDDVVIERSGDTEPQPQANVFKDQVEADVELILGDDISIAAVGLSAGLAGSLHWTKQIGEAPGRGEGRVKVVGGKYDAYGQKLSIERGALQFAGPLDNPILEVRAVRPDIDVVAGVAVNGSMRAPKFALFSQPLMPDSDILSYIITGYGLDDASSGEANLIARAALSLGAEQASVVTSQVQDAFGLDELSVNAGSTVQDTSFAAGKRLSPKLSARSTFNPFDQIWSFFVNYKLSPTWSIEAESGVRQGADIIYSVETEQWIPPGLFDFTDWFNWFGDDPKAP